MPRPSALQQEAAAAAAASLNEPTQTPAANHVIGHLCTQRAPFSLRAQAWLPLMGIALPIREKTELDMFFWIYGLVLCF